MKGNKVFTTLQINEIKKLTDKKIGKSKSEQTAIRNKIRNIYKFYYSDFNNKKGYTVADIEELISLGQIKISDIDYTSEVNITTKSIETPANVEKKIPLIKKSTGLKSIVKSFKINRFDPSTDNEIIISNSSVNYIFCLKKNSTLPTVAIKPILTNFEGLEVIYTGLASGSLRSRDFRQHFKGNNAGRSTLRKSLGVLFGYKQIPRDSDPTTGKTKFNFEDEQKLSEWMCNNLVMYFLPTPDFKAIEIELINQFNPPLNLKDNRNIINFDYRRLLSSLRSKKYK